jgi:hypothetical protein
MTIQSDVQLPTDPIVIADGSTELIQNTSPEKPRRNLTEAFEALCTAQVPGNSVKEKTALVSPTNVADFLGTQETPVTDPSSVSCFPELNLHQDLRRDLSTYCVQRVSTYSLIHDINKECSAMAQHDPLAVLVGEKDSLLVIAAQAERSDTTSVLNTQDPAKIHDAVIDEEQWLLSAISTRTAQETFSVANSDCPSTFLQAMGEKEYENPVQLVAGHSRTQLWKPSRSWWEAKSGKNPWIEPSSHNKRWRYLWPLIHYHKFLAKCIKKLKRNGVDVKQSISPVSVFLREEVCAVSDHLASVSLFGSEEWMACLEHFDGWTLSTPNGEAQYRDFVRHLPLRSLSEPGDVDSPILRSQVDENFLRAMAAQRDQFRENATAVTACTNNQVSTKKNSTERSIVENLAFDNSVAAPAIQSHPIFNRSPSQPSVPRHIHGVRRPRFFPQPGAWYGWEGQSFQDNSSVLSELSASSYPQHPHGYDFSGCASGVYPVMGAMSGYYTTAGGFAGSTDQSQSSDPYAYNGYQDPSIGWVHPFESAGYTMQSHHTVDGYYGHPNTVSPSVMSPNGAIPNMSSASMPLDSCSIGVCDPAVTPFKYDPDSSITHSPYWSHLDQATISMGLATPAKPPTPTTPSRGVDNRDDEDKYHVMTGDHVSQFAVTATAPLLRQHYYSLGNYGRPGSIGSSAQEAFVPPSPATQFMMSPHAIPGGSFVYPYGYGFSPRLHVRPAMMTPHHMTSKTIPELSIVSPSAETISSFEPVKLAELTINK